LRGENRDVKGYLTGPGMEGRKVLSERVTYGQAGQFAKACWQSAGRTDSGLLLALVLAAIARVLGIFTRPIWYDEAFAILFASKGPAAMMVGTLTPTGAGASDIHPLGYYTLLWAWIHALGDSLASVRGLSILAGLGAVIVGYALTRSLADRHAATVAALLLALSPFQVHYSQEIRMYSFLGLWLGIATYCYWQGANSKRVGWWLGFSVSAVLAQYTHNLAAAYLLALAMWPVLRRERAAVVRVALAGLAALLLYVPWLINVPAQFAKVSHAYWIERPPLIRLLTLPLAFVTNLPVPPALLGLALSAALGVVAFGLFQTIRRSPQNPGRDRASHWMLYMSFAPPLLVFGFSQWIPVYLERALIASGATFCIWLACQFTAASLRSAGRWMLAGLAALGFSIGLWVHLTYRGFPYAPFAPIASELRTHLQVGDVLVHSSKLSFLPTLYFDPKLPASYIADPPGSRTDTLAPGTQMVLGIHGVSDLEMATKGATRVWFVLFDQSDQEYLQAGDLRHPHLTWLMLNFRLVEITNWDDLRLYLFVADEPHGVSAK
jgi:4-amino-4-deoxy-L-arabinose transferase-like glycosyltransferase